MHRIATALLAGAIALGLQSPLHAQTASDAVFRPVPRATASDGTKFNYIFDTPARWPSQFRWRYNPAGAPQPFASNPATTVAAMQAALAQWTAVCNVQVAYDGMTTIAPDTRVQDPQRGEIPDSVNVVGWVPMPSGIAGMTTPWYGDAADGSRVMVDTDIGVDPSSIPDAPRLQRLLAHEFGHALGLGHSDQANVMMSGPPDSSYNAVPSLAPDDVRGCRCLYGPANGQSAGYFCSIPHAIDFGAVAPGAAAVRTFTLLNQGNAPMRLNAISTSEAAYRTAGCAVGSSLAPGQSCTVEVTFAPSSPGARSASLSIDVGDAAPYAVALTGAATQASGATVSASSVGFGSVTVGTASTIQRVKFSNGGSTQVQIASIGLEGAQPADFASSGTCVAGMRLASGENCNIDLRFVPTVAGNRTARAAVQTTDGVRETVDLVGTGIAPASNPSSSNLGIAVATAVEYYHGQMDHYFVTSTPGEIAALDAGQFPGWSRTGSTFKSYAAQGSGTTAVCRIYLPAPSSHFYGADPNECATVKQNNPSVVVENWSALYVVSPDHATGACPASTLPVYRVWNHRPDTNHRYTTDRATRDRMVANGYVAEGYGADGVVWCVPQ